MTFDISNPSDVKKLEKEEKLKEIQSEKDLKWVLSKPEGRRFIWRLLSSSNIFTANHLTSEELHFVNGRRSVGLKFLDEILKVDSMAFVEMMQATREQDK